VIITFIYRVSHRGKVDLEQMEPVLHLTTVDLYMNTGTNTNTWALQRTGTGTKQNDPMNEVTTSVYTVTVTPGPRTQEQEQVHQVAKSQTR